MIDKLPERLVQEGREHPFTEALLRELRERRKAIRGAIEVTALTASPETLRAQAAKASLLTELIDLISNAKGKDE